MPVCGCESGIEAAKYHGPKSKVDLRHGLPLIMEISSILITKGIR